MHWRKHHLFNVCETNNSRSKFRFHLIWSLLENRKLVHKFCKRWGCVLDWNNRLDHKRCLHKFINWISYTDSHLCGLFYKFWNNVLNSSPITFKSNIFYSSCRRIAEIRWFYRKLNILYFWWYKLWDVSHCVVLRIGHWIYQVESSNKNCFLGNLK